MKKTFLSDAIFKAIKAHNEKHEYLVEINRGIKPWSMSEYKGNISKQFGNTAHFIYNEDYSKCTEIPDTYMNIHFEVKFRPEDKYEDNIAIYQVCIISSGEMSIYYDGSRYE